MKAGDLYNLGLHETGTISDNFYVTRVPGGWIYEIQKPQADVLETVFVPFNNEFQLKTTKDVYLTPSEIKKIGL